MASEGSRALNIIGLDPKVNEVTLKSILEQAGRVTNIRITPDNSFQFGGLSSALVEFGSHSEADNAITTFNGTKILDSVISLSWAFSHRRDRTENTADHWTLWIGELSNDVSDDMLHRAFSQFSTVSDARVLWDPSTGKPRGYGFVSFRDKLDADKAMATMNGVTVGKKPIRVNWAHQKNASSTVASLTGSIAEGGKIGAYSSSAIFVPPTKPSLNYNQVLNQASAYHTTVYVGGIPPNCTIDMLTPVFQPYGHLVDIRVTPERGFAFVRYDSHENAATAISYVHGLVLNGCKLKLSWGKDKAADALYAKQQLEVTTPASSATSPNSYYGANAMQSAGYQSYYGGMAMPAYNGYDQATAYYYACYDPQWKEYYEKTYGPMPANNQQQVAQAQSQGQAQQQQEQQSQYQA